MQKTSDSLTTGTLRLALLLGACLGPGLLPAKAAAQQVGDCDWRASVQTLVEPWEDNSRTFAKGAVRLALLDTIEPGVGPLHLLILSPPYDDWGGRQCRVVSLDEGMGFAAVDFAALTAGYDPARGLQFDLPVEVFDAGSGGIRRGSLSLTLNQSTGVIEAGLQ